MQEADETAREEDKVYAVGKTISVLALLVAGSWIGWMIHDDRRSEKERMVLDEMWEQEKRDRVRYERFERILRGQGSKGLFW